MTSNWALPSTVVQYSETDAEEVHVPWLEIENFQSIKTLNGKNIRTARDILHIARDPKSNIKEKTYFLKITNFKFKNLPNIISGIELKITMNRFGRITDETVQLCLNDELIGKNQADRDLSPIKLYGNENDMWETNLSIENITNSSFGVILRFQSHPSWPHKCSALIDAVELRIH